MSMEIWTEKYRPKTLDEVINQKHVVERLKVWVKQKSIPNMLFAGSAGVGKTTLALALAKDLFGTNWQYNFQETNASDERGINVVRGRIKDFAKMKPLESDFKIVFLDESDALTPEAQQALRRTIEKYSGICRFILSCNYSSKIIEPIQSRMAVFRFRKLSKEDVIHYVKRVAEREGFKIGDDAKDAVFEVSEGDLRKATNILQSAAALGEVTRDNIYSVVSMARPKDIQEMVGSALQGKFTEARNKLYDLLINQGLSGQDIIREIHRHVFDLELDESKKVELIEKIGEFEYRLNQGGSDEIQLEALLAQFLKYKR